MAKTNNSIANRIKEANQICNDSLATDRFYKDKIETIRSLVYKFGDLGVEAEDIFHDGFLSAANAVKNGNYNGQSDFGAYFYVICKNLCLKKSNSRKEIPSSKVIDETLPDEIKEDYSDLIKIMSRLKETIDTKCKEIIDLRFGIGFNDNRRYSQYGTSYSEIANKLNITEANARKRFSNCIKDFREVVMGHSQFQLLQFNAEKRYHFNQIRLIVEGKEKIYGEAQEKRIKNLNVFNKVNKEISKLWIESEYLERS